MNHFTAPYTRCTSQGRRVQASKACRTTSSETKHPRHTSVSAKEHYGNTRNRHVSDISCKIPCLTCRYAPFREGTRTDDSCVRVKNGKLLRIAAYSREEELGDYLCDPLDLDVYNTARMGLRELKWDLCGVYRHEGVMQEAYYTPIYEKDIESKVIVTGRFAVEMPKNVLLKY